MPSEFVARFIYNFSVMYAEHKQELGSNAKFYHDEKRIKQLRNKWLQNTRKLGRENKGEKRRS